MWLIIDSEETGNDAERNGLSWVEKYFKFTFREGSDRLVTAVKKIIHKQGTLLEIPVMLLLRDYRMLLVIVLSITGIENIRLLVTRILHLLVTGNLQLLLTGNQ